MGKKLIIGIIIGIIIIAIALIFFNPFGSNELVKEIDECVIQIRYEPEDDCFRNIAPKIENPSICDKTKNSLMCYLQLALWSEDISICDEIPKAKEQRGVVTPDYKKSCYDFVEKG